MKDCLASATRRTWFFFLGLALRDMLMTGIWDWARLPIFTIFMIPGLRSSIHHLAHCIFVAFLLNQTGHLLSHPNRPDSDFWEHSSSLTGQQRVFVADSRDRDPYAVACDRRVQHDRVSCCCVIVTFVFPNFNAAEHRLFPPFCFQLDLFSLALSVLSLQPNSYSLRISRNSAETC